MHFAYPNLFWLSALAVVVAGLAALALWRKRRALRRLSAQGIAGPVLLVSRPVQAVKAGLLAGAAVLLAVAVLGPQWGWTDEKAETQPARGRDVLVLLDVSNSMLAEDMTPVGDTAPSRLNRARADIRRLAKALEQRGGFRIGLIAFADRAVQLCPLTFDFRCFEEEVASASLGAVRFRGQAPGEAGTDIASGLERAEKAIDKDLAPYTDVLLFSDGGDLEDGALDAADRLAKAGVPVHAIGLGDPVEEAPIPVKGPNGLRTLLKDDQGQVVRTRLEEELLRQIARRTRGHYLAVGTGSLDVDRLIAEVLGTRPTRELKKGGQGRMYVHRFQWFLAPALALLLLEMFFGDGRHKAVPSGSGAGYFSWRRRKQKAHSGVHL
jgi:Ca-activated chloride channel family protein